MSRINKQNVHLYLFISNISYTHIRCVSFVFGINSIFLARAMPPMLSLSDDAFNQIINIISLFMSIH